MPPQTILIIEDDNAIRRGVADALAAEGFRTIEAATGPQAADLANTAECDLVLLDLVLPGADGLDILRDIRRTRPTLPVIILTALGDEHDRVAGLNRGADDYVVKPFSAAELLARVQAVLRRTPERPIDLRTIQLPNVAVDLECRALQYTDGTAANLSEREATLLRYLACNPSRIIARDELLARVWQLDPKGLSTRAIDMHIARLRDKLHDHDQSVITTVRGKGYRFNHNHRP